MAKETEQTFGTEMRICRERAVLSLGDLSEMTGLSTSLLSFIETDKRAVTDEVKILIANALEKALKNRKVKESRVTANTEFKTFMPGVSATFAAMSVGAKKRE